MNSLASVALVSAAYPPYSWGGIDIQTYDLAHQLSAVGIQVTVFCGRAHRPVFTRESKNLKLCRLPVLDLPPRVIWFQLQNYRTLLKELQGFDLVHSQHSSGSLIGFMKSRIQKPWVVSFHDHQLRRLLTAFNLRPWKLSPGDLFYYTLGYPIFELLSEIELKWADHYIVCGNTGSDDYRKFSKMKPGKTTLIQNGIDLEKISSLIKTSKENHGRSPNGDFTLFTCGRLNATKGFDFLIRAMPLILDECRDTKLKIFGKGPLAPHLNALIDSLNLNHYVKLQGHVSYPHLIREMNQSDLAVFPSMVEVGASIAVMEAMACSRTVVAFDYPFSKEVIEHLKTGYLVPKKNSQELAKAICLLLQDEDLRKRIGQEACNYIIQNHNYKDIIDKYVQVYSQMLAERCD